MEQVDEDALFDAFLKNDTVLAAVRKYFTTLTRFRHFYGSHFEVLPPWARDYSLEILKDPHVLEATGASGAEVEAMIERVFKEVIQGEARGRSRGDWAVSGSRASVCIAPSDELLEELSCAKWVPEGKDGKYITAEKRWFGDNPPWLDPKFPDPYIYFAIKRWLKKLYKTHLRNVMWLVRIGVIDPKGAGAILAGLEGEGAISSFASLGHLAKKRADRLERDRQVYASLTQTILGALKESMIGLIRFAMEARLLKGVREKVQAISPGEARDYQLLVNRIKAIRNRYDLICDPRGSLLGNRLNRKRLRARFTTTAGSIQRYIGTTTGYAEEIVQNLKNQYLLPYLAHPLALEHIQKVFAPADWPKIKVLASVIGGSLELKNKITQLGGFYPSYTSDVKAYARWKAAPGKKLAPLNPQALLRAIIQALSCEAFLNIDSKQPESRASSSWRALAIQYTRMVYALDYVAGLGAGFPDGKKVPAYFRRGLSFLLEIPGIVPHQNLTKALDKQVAAVLTERHLLKESLAGVDPSVGTKDTYETREKARFGSRKVKDKETGAEVDVPWFSMRGRGFWKAIWDILGVLAVIKVFRVPKDGLRNFIGAAQAAWDSRFSGGAPDVFKDILSACKLIAPPERKKEYALVPIPVMWGDSGIARLPDTLRRISQGIAADPKVGAITFSLQISLHEDYTAYNQQIAAILEEHKLLHESQRGAILRPEDPKLWGIGDRVGQRAKNISGIRRSLSKRALRAALIPPESDNSLPGKITSITKQLGWCKAAEVDLDCLRRRYVIYLFLNKVVKSKKLPKDIVTVLNAVLGAKHFHPLTDYTGGEVPAFGTFDLQTDPWAFVTQEVEIDSPDIGAWVNAHVDACNLIGIFEADGAVKKMFTDADGYVKEIKGVLDKLAGRLDAFIYGRGLGRMGLSSQLRLAQIDLEMARAEEADNAVSSSPTTLVVDPRTRFQRALEYFLDLYGHVESALYKFFHPKDNLFPCKIKIPDGVAWRIYQGANIASISLLQPGRGGTSIANIELRGPPRVVHADPLYLAKVTTPSLGWPPGGAVGMDDNRLPCPRTFNFGRIPTKDDPGALDTEPMGGKPQDVPGEHLARLLRLWCYGEEGAKVRYGDDFKDVRPRPLRAENRRAGFNTFKGNKSFAEDEKCGAHFHAPEGKEKIYCKDCVPADHFFQKIWANCVVADTNTTSFRIDLPFACQAGESRLRVPTEDEPLNPDAATRAPTTSDQLGMVGQFWGVKRLHLNAKIRALQSCEDTLRKRCANLKASGVPLGALGLTGLSRLQESVGHLRRVHRDFLCRDARTGTLRSSDGRYLFRQGVFYLAQAAPSLAANEHLRFTAREGKAQLNALVQAMFKAGLRQMLAKVVMAVRANGISNAPPFAEVRAAGTSMYHFECGGVRKKCGLVDRRASADHGQCRLCGRIVDCHQNAARNIASSHPDYDPPP